ncbi:MAG: aldo/keto reductase [Pseudonocardia sp.]
MERLRSLVPDGVPMARFALRWVLDQPVTVVIPGARDAEQARGNAAAAALGPLSTDVHDAVREVYAELVAPHVHDRW